MRKYRPRIHYTEADKFLMWDRWQPSESLPKIARLFDRYPYFGAAHLGRDRWHPSPATQTIPLGPEWFGTQGDFARHCSRPFDPVHRPNAGSLTFYHQPRVTAQ